MTDLIGITLMILAMTFYIQWVAMVFVRTVEFMKKMDAAIATGHGGASFTVSTWGLLTPALLAIAGVWVYGLPT